MFRKLVLMLMFFSMGIWISPMAYATDPDLFATGQDSSGNYLFRVTSDGSIYTASDLTVTGSDIVIGSNSVTMAFSPTGHDINISTPIHVTGKVLATSAVGTYETNTAKNIFSLIVSSAVLDRGSCTLSAVSGKAGWATVITTPTASQATFSFETDGAPTIISSNTLSNNIYVGATCTDGKVNIMDGGTNPIIVNELGANEMIYVKISYIE